MPVTDLVGRFPLYPDGVADNLHAFIHRIAPAWYVDRPDRIIILYPRPKIIHRGVPSGVQVLGVGTDISIPFFYDFQQVRDRH